ncbi:hypothetical protein LUZ61_011748 [Rhynchospora tenuis]|uniref:Uncharacterized protein n=1 Tax=Rhynchospora tenuis TaxID=198213 RepID=A0AAD6F0V3_9POAL|nr:hypothetical protein LUZ61_011748 [Rhynchospora tenuis]
MWRQYIRAMAEDPTKRTSSGPGSYGGGMFRRYSPTTWAVGGVLVAGAIGYYMFYDKSKRHKGREYDRDYRSVPTVADRDRDVRTK